MFSQPRQAHLNYRDPEEAQAIQPVCLMNKSEDSFENTDVTSNNVETVRSVVQIESIFPPFFM